MRTVFYAFSDDADEPIARQRKRAEAAGFRIDAVVCEEPGYNRETALCARPRGECLFKVLAPGDTLLIDGVECLGHGYASVFDALQGFMRLGVVVKTISSRLTFDGATADPIQQAARDAFIAFVAAQAEADAAKRQARREPVFPSRPRVGDEPTSPFDRQSALLQLRVFAAQIAVLAVIVFGFGASAPGSHAPAFSAVQPASHGTQNTARAYPTQEGRSTFRRPWERQDAQAARQGAPAPKPPQAGAAVLGLSRDQQLKVLHAVADWRSARLRRPDVAVSAGATIPRAIRLGTFPRQLTLEIPELRGYKFLVADGRIAVVDPATLRVLGLIQG